MEQLLILELFAGTCSIGNPFVAAGHKKFSIEWSKEFGNIELYADILTVTADYIEEHFGLPDVIWASPDCTTFSIAAISHHRRKNEETGNLDPVSDYAKFCDEVDQHVLSIIDELNNRRLEKGLRPLIFFIENPVGALRKMLWMKKFEEKYGNIRHTVTYCQYELDKPVSQRRKKPTDIWTNHPDPQFRPMCKNGDPCHAAAPRGAKTGTQGLKGSKERAVIPRMLCEHIVYICEKEFRLNIL